MLVYTTGTGVNGFTFDPGIGVFFLSHPNMKIPENGKIYSDNEGNRTHFKQPIKDFIIANLKILLIKKSHIHQDILAH